VSISFISQTSVGKLVEQPAELPFEQPTRFRFLINLKTTTAIGLTVPDKVIALADEVID
jgi:ABC-type uncharacterized transport system substrate-binding protein